MRIHLRRVTGGSLRGGQAGPLLLTVRPNSSPNLRPSTMLTVYCYLAVNETLTLNPFPSVLSAENQLMTPQIALHIYTHQLISDDPGEGFTVPLRRELSASSGMQTETGDSEARTASTALAVVSSSDVDSDKKKKHSHAAAQAKYMAKQKQTKDAVNQRIAFLEAEAGRLQAQPPHTQPPAGQVAVHASCYDIVQKAVDLRAISTESIHRLLTACKTTLKPAAGPASEYSSMQCPTTNGAPVITGGALEVYLPTANETGKWYDAAKKLLSGKENKREGMGTEVRDTTLKLMAAFQKAALKGAAKRLGLSVVALTLHDVAFILRNGEQPYHIDIPEGSVQVILMLMAGQSTTICTSPVQGAMETLRCLRLTMAEAINHEERQLLCEYVGARHCLVSHTQLQAENRQLEAGDMVLMDGGHMHHGPARPGGQVLWTPDTYMAPVTAASGDCAIMFGVVTPVVQRLKNATITNGYTQIVPVEAHLMMAALSKTESGEQYFFDLAVDSAFQWATEWASSQQSVNPLQKLGYAATHLVSKSRQDKVKKLAKDFVSAMSQKGNHWINEMWPLYKEEAALKSKKRKA